MLKVTKPLLKHQIIKQLIVIKVLVCIGRKPYLKGLDLEKLGIQTDKDRVIVNSYLQTSVSNIFAIGDLIHGPMLAHKAEEEGVCVAEYIAKGFGHVNYNTIPGVIYTQPEVASVGKTEQELQQESIAYNIGKFPFIANARARCLGDTEGFVKNFSG